MAMSRPTVGLLFLLLVSLPAFQPWQCTVAAQPAVRPAASASVNDDLAALNAWRAGHRVSEHAVAAYGLARCFVAEPLSDAVFRRMRGKSYKAGCPVKRTDLRYLRVLHCDAKGQTRLGEMVCHSGISADLLSIFRQLYEARYPIASMVLIDNYDANDERSMAANNSSCFNYRPVAGSRTLSRHSYGLAVDINPLYNPYVVPRRGRAPRVTPVAGQRYADRSQSFTQKIDHDDLCYRLFRKHGFRWGGDWRSRKDYQHFEK